MERDTLSIQSRNSESFQKRVIYQILCKFKMAGVPLSFAIKRSCKTHSVSKSNNSTETDVKKVFISEFSRESDEVVNETKYVIPKQENQFNLKNSFTPSFLPKGTSFKAAKTGEDRFEAAAVSEEPTGVKYGLHERHPLAFDTSSDFISEKDQELETFRSELATLPDEADSQAYDSMPVDAFGLAMLRGMGWKEGQVLGKNKTKKAVNAMEFIPRGVRLGLGAAPDSHNKKNRKKRDPVMVLPVQSDGRVRHVRALDEELVPYNASGIKKGTKMKIQNGIHEGLICTVLETPTDTSVPVQLSNDEVVQLSIEDLSEEITSRNKKRKTEVLESSSVLNDEESWMLPHIRVRIIDKKLEKGTHYLKKGTIVDIVRPNVANIVLDSSQKLLEDVKSVSIETVIPKTLGSKVMVLTGEFRGQKGKLMDNTSDQKTVQLLSDLSILKFTSRQISEFRET